ncbi:MAG: hypothetical protein ACE5EA_02590 [Nitrospirota bacterium]
MFNSKKIIFIVFLLFLSPVNVLAIELEDISEIGLAFITNVTIHESGHYIAASGVGAKGNTLTFLTRHNGSFFFGLSTVQSIDKKSKFTYHTAGEIASSYTFEYSLRRFRMSPTTYNRSLLFFSSTDFLWYSLYAFYLSPTQNRNFDPVAIVQETGINKEVIVSIAAIQSILNTYRVVSDKDIIVPYFSFDRYSVFFNIKFLF